MRINTFDIDGVINLGELDGIYPGLHDVIITGRSYEETPETLQMLERKGINNQVYFNPVPFDKKTRFTSGMHKGKIILQLLKKVMSTAFILKTMRFKFVQLKQSYHV